MVGSHRTQLGRQYECHMASVLRTRLPLSLYSLIHGKCNKNKMHIWRVYTSLESICCATVPKYCIFVTRVTQSTLKSQIYILEKSLENNVPILGEFLTLKCTIICFGNHIYWYFRTKYIATFQG